MIRVIVIDDDAFVAASLTTILNAQNDIKVIAQGYSGEEAHALFDEHRPDVMLLDIQMPPNMDGLEAAEIILGDFPEARILFLTTFSDDEYIVRALQLGARGYLIKEEVASIAPAVRSVAAGQRVLAGEVVERVELLVGSAVRDSGAAAEAAVPCTSSTAAFAVLTEREMSIVELVAQGMDNKEIAAALYIGEGTVRNNISVILQKLELKNRTQLAVLYYKG